MNAALPPQPDDAEALWKLALEAVGDSVWDWHIEAGVELFSPSLMQLYGYEPGDIEPSPEALDSLTHPDDRAQMEQDREAHFSGENPVYRNEHRVLCKDGSWKWVLTRGLVIERDAQGRPLRMVGTHTDISARKASEDTLWRGCRGWRSGAEWAWPALATLPSRPTTRNSPSAKRALASCRP